MYKPKAQPFFYFSLLALLGLFFLQGCAINQQMSAGIAKKFKESIVFNTHFTGFALADPITGKLIYEKNADLYFIPASNVKLLNFYTALQLIPDSVPSLKYIERGDSLIFWGTGDPSFLHRRLKGTKAFDFLRASPKKLYFAAGRYTGNLYGQGWSWDDYNDRNQAEITELPLLDNLLQFSKTKAEHKLTAVPAHFQRSLKMDSTRRVPAAADFEISRNMDQNEFYYPAGLIPSNYIQLIPYKTSAELTLNLLSDTLKRPVELIRMDLPATAKTIYNMNTDSVLREMLLPSDNFIAEQLLLVYTNQVQTSLSSTDAIRYIQKNYLKELPGKPRWVDGSGLSRMNLLSPREMIWIVAHIDQKINDRKRLFGLLPAGGKTGTLKNAYPKTESPFVFAKTGTLSNNYAQSGYVVTKKGRTLYFSLMNNNFTEPIANIRKEMANLMTYIHDKF